VISQYELGGGIYDLTNDARRKIEREYRELSLQGFRVLGVAYRKIETKVAYNAADEMGILLMIGWSCHWEWEGYCGRYDDDFMAIRTPEDQELQARAFQDQVRWLRNHPSVFLWVFFSFLNSPFSVM